jgi:hypothetical protein
MALILWIVTGLIGIALYGLIASLLIEVGGGNICWPWEDCVDNRCVSYDTATGGGWNVTGDNQTSSQSDIIINDAQKRAVQTGIFAGAVLIRSYRDDQRAVDRLMKGLELAKESGDGQNRL